MHLNKSCLLMGHNAKRLCTADLESSGEHMSVNEGALRRQCTFGLESDIFQGVVVYINGLTVPLIDELWQLVLAGGGAFEQHYSPRRITHFICTHVAQAKVANFGMEQNELAVVRPEWIVDSAKEGRKLDERPYRLYLNDTSGTLSLNQDDVDLLADLISSERDSDSEREFLSECEEKAPMPSPPEDQISATFASSLAKTSSDPNFLSDYYKNSRLHHLSTWRESLKTYAGQLMAQRQPRMEKAKDGHTHIMHVDLDCFFVSVSLSNQSLEAQCELKDQPIAVCHSSGHSSNAATSSSDISSCNYAARSFGVRNGMYLRAAYQLCPQLKLLPYDFGAYNRVSRRFYETLADNANTLSLQAVSCDEAFIEVVAEDPLEEAARIRSTIKEACEVDASIGVGSNTLMARLATKKAKPSGQFRITDAQIEEFLADEPVDELPGVGRSLSARLGALSVTTCGQLRAQPLSLLQTEFGPKMGSTLYAKARGQDDRRAGDQFLDGTGSGSHRKSVGSEVSWGVRFENLSQCRRFVDDMSREIWSRLSEAFPDKDLKPRRLQLKLYRRRENAPAPHKHLGRGHCDVFHRSRQFPSSFASEVQFIREAWRAFDEVFLKSGMSAVHDIRGVGLFLSDFAVGRMAVRAQNNADLSNWTGKDVDGGGGCLATAARIDPSVLAELPEEIRHEFEAPQAARKQSPPPAADHTSSTTLAQLWSGRREREAEALRRAIQALPRDQYDPEVVLQLPVVLQKEIVRECEVAQRLKSIKPSSLAARPADKRKKATAQVSRRTAERLPIKFCERADWTAADLRSFVFLQHRDSDFDWGCLEDILAQLVTKDCMAPVVDCLRAVRGSPSSTSTVAKIKQLVKDMHNSDLLL